MNVNNGLTTLMSNFSLSSNKIIALVIFSLTTFITFLFIYHLDRGIDLTDTGFHMVSASQASNIPATVTSFGFYTGYFLELFDRSVFLFRLTGLFFLGGLAIFFTKSLMAYLADKLEMVFTVEKNIISYCLTMLGVLTYYQSWKITPSYNLLALGACLLVGTGLIRLIESVNFHKKRHVWSAITCNSAIVGIGYFFAIMSKPTTALCLGIVTLLWVFFTDAKKQWLKIILSIALTTLCLLALHVFSIEAAIDSILVRTLAGIEYVRLADMGHDSYSLIRKFITDLLAIPLKLSIDLILASLTFIFLLFGLRLLSLFKPHWCAKYKLQSGEIIICISTSVFCLIMWIHGYWDGGPMWRHSGYAGIALVLYLILIGFTSSVVLENKIQFDKGLSSVCGLILLNISLAISFGVGSNNGAIVNSSMAYVFYVSSIFVGAIWISKQYNFKFFLPLITCILVLSSLSMSYGAFFKPYRIKGTIFDQQTPVKLTNGDTNIYADVETAAYINQLQSAAMKHGWQQGNILIDMTGATPLASYLLDAKPATVGWILGGYKGSNSAAYYAISSLKKDDLNKAWVLTCLECKRQISADVLLKLEIDLNADFERVAQLKTGHRNEMQILWKPKT